jgi:integrase
VPAVSFSRFRTEVEEIYSLRQPATLCIMKQVLREIALVEGVKKTSDLRPVIIARWLKAHPTRGAATSHKLLRSLSSAVQIGVASGYFRSSPIAFTIELPEPADDGEPKIRHHSIGEVTSVLELARAEALNGTWRAQRRYALVSTYAYSALRKQEALRLQRADVELDKPVLRIRARKRLKTRASAQAVPIAPPLLPVLEWWLPKCGSTWLFPGATRRGPWTGGPPGYKPLDEVKQLGERAGVPELTIQSFRHSFATHAPMWGISGEMVTRILRHTSPRTKRWYEHEDLDNLVAAVSRVSYTGRKQAVI